MLEGETVRRNLKRNIVIAAVLVFVGAAVYLNWSYNSRWGTADSAMVAAEDAAMLAAEDEYLAASAAAEQSVLSSAYFDNARLTRQASRDEALELLEMACAADTASQDVIDQSMRQINSMASWNLQESQLENELLAKDFTDCVVFVSDDGVTVAVPAPMEGLTDTQVAQITEAVLANTDYTAMALNIIEVKD
jgi:stage III sporulation protein AH